MHEMTFGLTLNSGRTVSNASTDRDEPAEEDQTMHTFMDAKLMAKLLRQALADRGIDIAHSDSLELVARQFGLNNWNILSAKIDANARTDVVPANWIRTGKSPQLYRVGVNHSEASAWIESRLEHAPQITDADFCTLMQSIDATRYRGSKLRLSAELKSIDVQGGVTIWLRVDGASGSIRFENLEGFTKDGPIASSTDWVRREIVLDVPDEARSVNYGFFLKGRGKGLTRSFALDEVSMDTPLTTRSGKGPDGPTNLDFRDVA